MEVTAVLVNPSAAAIVTGGHDGAPGAVPPELPPQHLVTPPSTAHENASPTEKSVTSMLVKLPAVGTIVGRRRFVAEE
jgi:hypothetical protein